MAERAASAAYRVRAMELEDVEAVSAVEGLCFPTPWPPETYRRDLRYHGNSHYLVVERAEGDHRLVGFCGYWLIDDEAHISTIGVHPDYRGLGLGEYLLASLLGDAHDRGARSASLEVRVSNSTAQALYLKYDFRVTGRRRRYYRDNREDALLMEVESLTGDRFQELFSRHRETLMRNLEEQAAGSNGNRRRAASANPGG